MVKRIYANSNPNLNPNSKVQKPFRDNKMTSFFGHVSDTGKEHICVNASSTVVNDALNTKHT